MGSSSGDTGSLSLRALERKILFSGVAILGGIAAAGEYGWLPGAACGAAIASGNFYLIRKILEKAIAPGGTIRKKFVVQYVLKFLALAAAVWILVRSGRFRVAGLLLGFSSLFLGVLVEGLTWAVKTDQGGR